MPAKSDVAVPSSEIPRRKPAKPAYRHQGLFPCEEEIARRLSQDPKDWAAISVILEREGLPRVDPFMRGRFWPAVEGFWMSRYGLSNLKACQPDGEENLDALR